MRVLSTLSFCVFALSCGAEKPASPQTSPQAATVQPSPIKNQVQKEAGLQEGEKQVVIKVAGMTCTSCSSGVTKKLKKAPGVVSAVVSHVTGTATVVYKAAETTPEKLRDVINEAGFSATL